MNRREASKTETRKLILDAARKLFMEKGVDKTTMRAIAKKAGVSPASVVVHFKNKTALLEVALCEDIDRTVAEAMESLPPPEAGLAERLMHVPRAMYAFYDRRKAVYRGLLRGTVFEPEADNPQISRQLEEYFQFLGGLIEDEKKRGHVRPDVDVPVAATSVASLYMGIVIFFFRNPEMTPLQAVEMLAVMNKQYLEGIMTSRMPEA